MRSTVFDFSVKSGVSPVNRLVATLETWWQHIEVLIVTGVTGVTGVTNART